MRGMTASIRKERWASGRDDTYIGDAAALLVVQMW
jgi:hypothetical protein